MLSDPWVSSLRAHRDSLRIHYNLTELCKLSLVTRAMSIFVLEGGPVFNQIIK